MPRWHGALADALACGWSLRRIEAETGIGRDHLCRINGRTARPLKRVRWATYQTLLDLSAQPAPVPPGRLIDGTGTQRRLHALIAIGWPKAQLAYQLSGGRALQIRPGLVTVRNAAKVQALYEQLWRTSGPSAAARRYAAERGWPPPLFWDDELIDDPTYQGEQEFTNDFINATKYPDTVRTRFADALPVVAQLSAKGKSAQQIAEHLGCSQRRVERLKAALRTTQVSQPIETLTDVERAAS
jgi:hypothetical protein